MRKAEKNEAILLMQDHYLPELGLEFEKEFCFFPLRGWRTDFRITNRFLNGQEMLIEIEGGAGYFKNPKGQVIRGGRHNRKEGFEEDMRKYNRMAVDGYMLLRFSTGMVKSGEALEFLREWLGGK